MSKLIQELMTAVETGDNLNEFATIANMTADEFTKAWGEDAVTALQAFVLGLSDTERTGKSATVALTELGITETRMQRMILSLSNSGDLLNRTLATSNRGWAENSALVKEAQLRWHHRKPPNHDAKCLQQSKDCYRRRTKSDARRVL